MDVTISELKIPEGWKGTKITIAEMWKLVNKNYLNRRLRNIAMDIVSPAKGHDYLGEADAIFRFVKGYITYRRDPDGAEWISDPFITLNDRLGDCDDQAILTATLAKSAGFPVRFVTVKTVDPDYYSHVFAEINVAGIWLAADTTEPKSYLGWHPKSEYGEKTWGDPSYKTVTEGGLSMLGAYIPTAGESLVLIKIQALIKEINGWGWLTTAATKRLGRDKLKVISADAQTHLADPKRAYVSGTADALWSGFSSLQDSGQTQSVYLRNLKKMETALQLQPNQVTTIIKETVLVQAPAPAAIPAPTQFPLVTPPTAPIPAETKILGMPKKVFAIATGAVLVAGGFIWWLKARKKK